MKNKNKELLLKDICSRLPYGVKMNHIAENEHSPKTLIGIAKDMITLQGFGGYECVDVNHYKPYLFPLSSMTEVQKNIYSIYIDELKRNDGTYFETIFTSLQFWLYANHFDVHGLIPLDLAIDATNKNIY